jgi:HEAT repeat protein
MGPQAREAVPALVEALRDVRIREETLEALRKIGPETPEAVPALIETLRIDGLRTFATQTLEGIGGRALPALVRAMKDENPNVRLAAVRIIGNLGPPAGQAVPALIAALQDPGRGVSTEAAIALGKVGPRAKEAVPDLFEALKNPQMYEVSMKALEQIGFDSKEAIPALIEALKHEDLRTYAVDRLLNIGPDAVPELIKALEGDYGQVREYAAYILGKMGPDARAAIPALTDALWDKDKRVRGTAQKALAEIQR